MELLRLHRVGILDVLEELGGEAGEPAEVELLTTRQRVADAEVAGVGQSDDVSGVGVLDDLLPLRHKGGGAAEAEVPPEADVVVIGIPPEDSGADLDKGDAWDPYWRGS